jgi:hypothetical protein
MVRNLARHRSVLCSIGLVVVACGGSGEPETRAPGNASPASNPVDVRPTTPTAAAQVEAAPRWAPPAPWVIAAEAPSGRRFVRYALEGTSLWAACDFDEKAHACMQPVLAIETADGLEETQRFAAGMPKLERDGGAHGLTGMYGRYPDDVWMTVERSGAEAPFDALTSLYRFDGAWKAVPFSGKPGERIDRMDRWHGGMLASVTLLGSLLRFDAFAVAAGVRTPEIPKNSIHFPGFVVQPDGAIMAYHEIGFVRLVGWSPRDPQPVTLTLRAHILPPDDAVIGDINFSGPGEVRVLGYGSLPVDRSPLRGPDVGHAKLRATLRLEKRRWRVIDQKLDDWKADWLPIEAPPSVKPLSSDTRFSPIKSGGFGLGLVKATDGSLWVEGEVNDAGAPRAVLLRDRAVKAPWVIRRGGVGTGATLAHPGG